MAPHAPLRATPPRSRWQRMAAPVATIGTIGALTVALHLRDPHSQGSWGFCPSAAMGFYCPGCGGLRAVNDLSNLQVVDAASSNLAFVVALPFILAGLAVWTVDRWRGHRRRVPMAVVSRVALTGLALVAVFTVLRNLSGSWLAP
ncbi:DUF2752 domain-containing protein [Nocardioides lijunqiniae]|uniref:DUF2752 domain-containing protein n=1 Tax=Nocardioides lijunqiniae TaxID=2760832 RepID=UPI001878A709|nr:DUF2752 domain-containing protein [Nocardioides lijunqiniae]